MSIPTHDSFGNKIPTPSEWFAKEELLTEDSKLEDRPAAWRWREAKWPEECLWMYRKTINPEDIREGVVAEPLYSANLISSLRGEVGELTRLREEDLLAFGATQMKRDEQNLKLQAKVKELTRERDEALAECKRLKRALDPYSYSKALADAIGEHGP